MTETSQPWDYETQRVKCWDDGTRYCDGDTGVSLCGLSSMEQRCEQPCPCKPVEANAPTLGQDAFRAQVLECHENGTLIHKGGCRKRQINKPLVDDSFLPCRESDCPELTSQDAPEFQQTVRAILDGAEQPPAAALPLDGHSKDDMRDMLEDVVNELDLSAAAIEEHGPLGTPPAELVRLVLTEKDNAIRNLRAGMVDAASQEAQQVAEGVGECEGCKELKRKWKAVMCESKIRYGIFEKVQKERDTLNARVTDLERTQQQLQDHLSRVQGNRDALKERVAELEGENAELTRKRKHVVEKPSVLYGGGI